MQLTDWNTFLQHGITETDCYTIVDQRIMVNRNTERSTYGILTTVTFTDGIFFIVLTTEIKLQIVYDLDRKSVV